MIAYSIIPFSEVEKSHGKRFDAEYWHPKFIKNENYINVLSQKFKVDNLSNCVKEITGSAFYPSIADYYSKDKGIPFIRVSNLGYFHVADQNIIRIPNEIAEKYSTIKTISGGDIVIAKGGSIGGVCLVQETIEKAATSRDVIVIRTNPTLINSEYLVLYLLSKYAQLQLDRNKSQQVQAHLTFPAIGNVEVVKVPSESQQIISDIVKKANNKQKESESLYRTAESILLNKIGFNNFKLEFFLTYISNYNKFINSNRLDAEYYQPKYKQLLDIIENTKESSKLGELIKEPISRGVQPKYDENAKSIVINSKHVGKSFVETKKNRKTNLKLYKNNKGIVKKLDVLLNSTGINTIGRCQTLLEDVSGIVDNHISIIRPKEKLDPIYLATFLNSPLGQLQSEQNWTGSSGQIELRPESVSNYSIWIAPDSIQKDIRNNVLQSEKLRSDSLSLYQKANEYLDKLLTIN